MNRQVKVEFDATTYTFNHGAAPKGRGCWAFGLEKCPTTDKIYFAPGCNTLAEAKKLAAEHYRAKLAAESSAPTCGSYALLTVYVLP